MTVSLFMSANMGPSAPAIALIGRVAVRSGRKTRYAEPRNGAGIFSDCADAKRSPSAARYGIVGKIWLLEHRRPEEPPSAFVSGTSSLPSILADSLLT